MQGRGQKRCVLVPFFELPVPFCMICPSFENTTDEEIKDYLDELEGDYYTFLDYNALEPLRNANLLDDIQVNRIVGLKDDIKIITPDLWNITSFKTDPKWVVVRNSAESVLDSMNISKRKLG